MIQCIQQRHSIRKYKSDVVPKEAIEQIIQVGRLTPSSKNRQPWHFIITTGSAKDESLCAMKQGLEREKNAPLLPESVQHLSGAENTLCIMQEAPVIIYIVNPLGLDIQRPLTAEERIYEICNAQSVGAAIENMTLTATEQGLGSLWIWDIYFAYEELTDWLNIDGKLLAALAVGYVNETPQARPRKDISDLVEWRQ